MSVRVKRKLIVEIELEGKHCPDILSVKVSGKDAKAHDSAMPYSDEDVFILEDGRRYVMSLTLGRF